MATRARSRARSSTSRRGRARRSRATRRVRYAVVGLGHIAQVAVLPAFAHARRNSELVALVSDDPKKLRTLARRYDVSVTRDYDAYDDLLRSGDVDAVYIALPNHLHRDYAVRAARAGVHVLCEKPMAVTERDAEAMIREARAHDVRLMIAYRLHFDRANLEAVRLARSGRLGTLRSFDSTFTMDVEPGDIRLSEPARGGGPLYDIGIYCINAARYLFADEPDEVFAFRASRPDARFRRVEEMIAATLRFPGDRLATFVCGFGSAAVASYRLVGTKGDVRAEPAYEYAEPITLHVTRNGRASKRTFPRGDQFAPELLHFSDCVRSGREPSPSGAEGLADVRIVRALYQSLRSGRPTRLGRVGHGRRPRPEQAIHRPPVEEPSLVHVTAPNRAD